MKYIDVHCHLFNRDVLSTGTRLILKLLFVKEWVNLIDDLDIDKLIKRIEGVVSFLDTGLSGSSNKLYREMQVSYNNNYILVPLMFDLSYITEDDKREVLNVLKKENQENNLVDDIKSEALNKLENKAVDKVTKQKNSKAVHEVFDKLEQRHSLWRKKFKTPLREFEQHVFNFSNLPVFANRGFKRQLRSLKRLKCSYRSRVYPFMGIDPRRNADVRKGLLWYVEKNIIQKNKFHGIKLYAPAGFSPTDPFLYDQQGLYALCQQHKIPITVHCSDGGFATLANEVKITGHILNSVNKKVVDVKTLFPDNIVQFTEPFAKGNFQQAISERANMINHPLIWNKVMERYPGLYINFAHLGGLWECKKYINDPDSDNWTKHILSLLSRYENAYTDMSAFSDENDITLADFKNKIYDVLPAHTKMKIMYGSDFYLSHLNTPNFNDYVNNFTSVFGTDFEQIAKKAPHRFLFER